MFKRVLIFAIIIVFFLAGIRMVASFFIGEYIKEEAQSIPVLKMTMDKVRAYPDTGEIKLEGYKIWDVSFKEKTELKLACKSVYVNFRWWESAGNRFLIADIEIDSPTFWVITRKQVGRTVIVEKTQCCWSKSARMRK